MSETKDIISQSINRLLADTIDRKLLDAAQAGEWQAPLWKLVLETGFHQAIGGADADGAGAWGDAYPIFHAIGRHVAPLPLAETLIGNALLAAHGLPMLDGPLTLLEQGFQNEVTCRLLDGRLLIDGAARGVPWARFATHLVLSATVDGDPVLALVELPQPEVSISADMTISREPRDMVQFRGYATRNFVPASPGLPAQPVLVLGALARAAMLVGAQDYLLDLSVRYANERVQFGRPIAKFQAVQHLLAVLASEFSAAQCATLAAFGSLDHGRPAATIRHEVAVAKARAGRAAGSVAAIAHQVHGAMGITYDHMLQYGSRRLWSWRSEFGAERYWTAELGKAAILGGREQVWRTMTSV